MVAPDGMVTVIVLRDPQAYENVSLQFTCLGDGYNFDIDEKGEYLGTFLDQCGSTVHLFVKVTT